MKKVSIYPILFLLMLFAFQIKAQQVKVLNLVQPYAFTFSSTNQDVIVEFKNIGAVDVNSVDFGMTFNGFGTIFNTWNGLLNPGNSTVFTIGLMGINGGTNTLQVTVGAVNGVAFADTANYILQTTSTALAIPFIDDMEGVANFGSSGNNWTTGLNPDSWQLAVPNYGSITPTGPGSKAWVLGLDSGYSNDIQTFLYSPIFNFAASGINSVWLHFTTNANLAANDNVTVQYSTDFITWTALPALSVTGNTGGWTGIGTGLSFLASEPQVQFRFVFSSDNSGTADGLAIDDFEIIQCVLSPINMNLLSPISCAGACDGVLEASPQIGLPPYTYLWDSGETTQSINVCAGTYNVTVTDANGCSGIAGLTVNQPTLMLANLGPDQSICNGSSALLCPNAFGGTPPYVYLWNTGAMTSCISVTTSGIYAITIFDANACTVSDDVIITVNAAPIINLGPDVSMCNGGSILLDAGSGGVTYQWSDGSASQTIVVVTGGVYTVTVTDFNGCTGTDDIVVSQLPQIVLQLHEVYNCFTSMDSIYMDIINGSGPYSYTWSNFQTTSYLLNPGPWGIYCRCYRCKWMCELWFY